MIYIIYLKKDIELLIHLFNDNLVLNKRICQLKIWLSIYNEIPYIDKKIVLILNSAWLSGFTDAEGCFNVSITTRTKHKVGFRTKLRFLLDQQFEQDCLFQIRNIFNTGNVALRSKTNQVFRYSTDSFHSIIKIINYFNKFPLKTVKAESFKK